MKPTEPDKNEDKDDPKDIDARTQRIRDLSIRRTMDVLKRRGQ